MSTTTSVNNQGGSTIVKWINSIDLSKYPELAQKIAAMNQIGLTLSENELLQETMAAQGKFIRESVSSGFESAFATTMYGVAEAAIGVGQAAAGGWQVKSAIQNASQISKLQNDTNAELLNLKSEANGEANSLIPGHVDEGTELQDFSNATSRQPGTTTIATEMTTAPNGNGTYKEDGIKLKTEKQILSEHEAELERLKALNTKETSIGQILQSLSQTGQLWAQSAQSNAQIAQMKQQVMNNNYSSAQASAQTASQTLQQALQFDPYAQNVASTRA
jgi:hypothetical protein